MLFPNMFIFSKTNFSVSLITKLISSKFETSFSSTVALIDLNSSLVVVKSISFNIFSTAFIEYGLPLSSNKISESLS